MYLYLWMVGRKLMRDLAYNPNHITLEKIGAKFYGSNDYMVACKTSQWLFVVLLGKTLSRQFPRLAAVLAVET